MISREIQFVFDNDDECDKYLSTWRALPWNLAISGGRTKPLKYSTKHPVLRDVGLWAPRNNQVPIIALPLRADIPAVGTQRRFNQPFWSANP